MTAITVLGDLAHGTLQSWDFSGHRTRSSAGARERICVKSPRTPASCAISPKLEESRHTPEMVHLYESERSCWISRCGVERAFLYI